MLEAYRRVTMLEIHNICNSTGNAYCDSCNNDIYYGKMDFANMVLAVHNRERAAVGVPLLVWSEMLAADAKPWADHMATTGEFAHDTAIFPAKGENIALGAAGFHSTEQLMQGWSTKRTIGTAPPSRTRICILSVITFRWSHLPRPTSPLVGERFIWCAAMTVAYSRRSRTHHLSCHGQQDSS
jgi:hypothetical protein